ncbi:hypothetical protein IAR50_006571 [Cryptococcus sp. DSM 104548]
MSSPSPSFTALQLARKKKKQNNGVNDGPNSPLSSTHRSSAPSFSGAELGTLIRNRKRAKHGAAEPILGSSSGSRGTTFLRGASMAWWLINGPDASASGTGDYCPADVAEVLQRMMEKSAADCRCAKSWQESSAKKTWSWPNCARAQVSELELDSKRHRQEIEDMAHTERLVTQNELLQAENRLLRAKLANLEDEKENWAAKAKRQTRYKKYKRLEMRGNCREERVEVYRKTGISYEAVEPAIKDLNRVFGAEHALL